jgi:hypothetical protein
MSAEAAFRWQTTSVSGMALAVLKVIHVIKRRIGLKIE